MLGDIGSGSFHYLLIFAQDQNVCLVVITLHYSWLEGRARGREGGGLRRRLQVAMPSVLLHFDIMCGYKKKEERRREGGGLHHRNPQTAC